MALTLNTQGDVSPTPTQYGGGGKHKRIPSYMKPITLTKVDNPLEVNRKMVYEAIAQKIHTQTSNPSMATMNDEDFMLGGSKSEHDLNNNDKYKMNDDAVQEIQIKT